jgi:ribose 5-phosphate isomerase B
MKIAIGSDHAGFRYKEKIKMFLQELGHTVKDFGTFSDEPVDYPLYIRPVAEAVGKGTCERGIILGGSGNGEAIVANRIPGIRCTLCWNVESALMARKHNDSNMLSLGERMIPEKDVLEIVKTWLDTPFDGGRHLQRIRQIDSRTEAEVRKDVPTEPSGPRTPVGRPPAEYDVFIAFRYIKYMEGKESILFEVEPGLKVPTLIKIPSPERWDSVMPSWSKGRREEILARVRSKCGHMNFEFLES